MTKAVVFLLVLPTNDTFGAATKSIGGVGPAESTGPALGAGLGASDWSAGLVPGGLADGAAPHA